MKTITTSLDKYDINEILDILSEYTEKIGYDISYGTSEDNQEYKEMFQRIIDELNNIKSQM